MCYMQFIPFNNPLSCVCVCVFLKYHLSNTLPLMLDFFCIIRTDDYFCAFFFLCCVSAHYERYHNHRALIYSSITHLSLSLMSLVIPIGDEPFVLEDCFVFAP